MLLIQYVLYHHFKTLRPSLWRGLHQYNSGSRDPIMLRKAIKAVPEGNDPVPQKEELGSGQSTMESVYRRIKLMMSHFEEQTELL